MELRGGVDQSPSRDLWATDACSYFLVLVSENTNWESGGKGEDFR